MLQQKTHSKPTSKARTQTWSITPYLGKRLVVLNKDEPIHAAVRAMEANGVGCILIEDEGCVVGLVTDRDLALWALGYNSDWTPKNLRELIHRPLESVGPKASLAEVIDVMVQCKVRRVPVLDEKGRACGLVTLDDLLAEGVISPEDTSEIVWVQLAQPARFKRVGDVGPSQPRAHSHPTRSAAHSLQTLIPLLDSIVNYADFGSRAKAEEALCAVTEMLVQRITPEQAKAFMSQLPKRVAEYVEPFTFGPDTSIGADALLAQVSKALDVPEERAKEITQAVFKALEETLTGGLLSHVLSQLPLDMKQLLKPA